MHGLARPDHLDLDREVHMNHLPEPVDVFIPASYDTHQRLGIRRGSAVTGTASPTAEPLDIYFQDDASGSLPTFADRAMHAAGRMVHRAPTIARMTAVPASELLYVGVYDDRDGELLVVDDPDAREELRIWLGLVDVTDLERERHTSTSMRHQQRRDLRAVIADAHISTVARDFARQHGHEDLLDPPATPKGDQ